MKSTALREVTGKDDVKAAQEFTHCCFSTFWITLEIHNTEKELHFCHLTTQIVYRRFG
jgi:hypothetical protein